MDHRPIDEEMAGLLLAQRWGALALSGEDGPAASMVAYAVEPALRGLLFFLSGLAGHTGLLLADGRAALAVSAPDRGTGDPQQLARISLSGRAAPLARGTGDFEDAWAVYASRFPAALPRLALADFALFRFVPEGGRYVGGFARAVDVHPARLASAVAALESR